METYTFLRELADSWFMLAMLLGFIGIIIWVLLGKSKSYRDTAESIFRNEDAPAGETLGDGNSDAATGKEARK